MEDSDKYGQHVDSYEQMKAKEVIATEARGGHVLHAPKHSKHGRKLQATGASDDLQSRIQATIEKSKDDSDARASVPRPLEDMNAAL